MSKKLTVIDVVSEHVKLTEVVKDEAYRGMCPFCEDDSNSMLVTREVFRSECCEKEGSMLDFLILHEHYTESEALKYIEQLKTKLNKG